MLIYRTSIEAVKFWSAVASGIPRDTAFALHGPESGAAPFRRLPDRLVTALQILTPAAFLHSKLQQLKTVLC